MYLNGAKLGIAQLVANVEKLLHDAIIRSHLAENGPLDTDLVVRVDCLQDGAKGRESNLKILGERTEREKRIG